MASNQTSDFIRPEKFWQSLGLRANQTVVHLGCGPGFYLIPAAKMVGKRGAVIGVDVRGDTLQEAESRARREGVEDRVTTIRDDLENGTTKGLRKDIADWTLVANVLYQADPFKILKEAKRITRPGGAIIMVEWNVADTPIGPPHEVRIPKQNIIKLADQLKLKVTEQFEPSPYHYGLLLSPPNS